jgi:hypothetical protein
MWLAWLSSFIQKETQMSFTHADRAMLYRVLANQEDMFGLLNALQQKEDTMALDLTDLTAKVAANTDAEASTVTLLTTIKGELDAAIAALPTAADTAALQALSDQIGANTAGLAAAVVANTPAA